MKAVLSQTAFCGAVHLHGNPNNRLLADLDCNGWPQTPSRRALSLIRKAQAVHLCGDQHLAVVYNMGFKSTAMAPMGLRDLPWSTPFTEDGGIRKMKKRAPTRCPRVPCLGPAISRTGWQQTLHARLRQSGGHLR